jgi:hypothetical protein
VYRRFALVVALVVGLTTMTAPVALARSPWVQVTHWPAESGTTPAGPAGLPCSFDVTVSSDWSYNATELDFRDGSITYISPTTEKDTFTANGKTLVGNRYGFVETLVINSSGKWIYHTAVGTMFSVTLPNGTRLVSTGLLDFIKHPVLPVWTVDIGHNANFNLFCAYFTS